MNNSAGLNSGSYLFCLEYNVTMFYCVINSLLKTKHLGKIRVKRQYFKPSMMEDGSMLRQSKIHMQRMALLKQRTVQTPKLQEKNGLLFGNWFDFI